MPAHRIVGFLTALVLALAGSVATLHAEDEPASPTITVGGESLGATALRAREASVRAALAKLNEGPAVDPEARKLATEPRVALASALETAIELRERIAEAPASAKKLKAEIERAQAKRQSLAQKLAQPVTLPEVVNDDVIRELEAASAKAAQDVLNLGDVLQKLEDALKKRVTDFDALPAVQAERKARAEKLLAELEKTAEDAVQARQLLSVQITTSQVRRGLADLRKAHHVVLLELDTQQRDLVSVQLEAARLQQEIANAQRAKARVARQAQLDEEAKIRELEAQQKLRDVALASTPAAKAIARLKALLLRMQTESTQDQKSISVLKTLRDEGSAIAQTAKTRLASIQLLYPVGTALEPWQREGLAEQIRLQDQDRAAFDRFRSGEDMRGLNALMAQTLIRNGRIEIFDHRLAAAQDRIERTDDEALRVASIERELEHSRDEDYRFWLKARLDFLRGQANLQPADVARLRVTWEQYTSDIKKTVKARREALAEIRSTGEDLRKEIQEAATSLEARRDHLAGITFWLRETPLFSDDNWAATAEEAGELAERTGSLPADVVASVKGVTEESSGVRGRTFLVYAFLLLALFFGLRLRRRLVGTGLLALPIRSLSRWGRGRRVIALFYRAAWIPAIVLIAALYVNAEVFSGRALGTGLLALAVMYAGWGFARGLNHALFTPDEAGDSVVACDLRSALGARRVVGALVFGSGVFLGLLLIFRAAEAPHLARLVGFAWGALAALIGAWLVMRHDVLTVFVPPGRGGLMTRTLRGLLRVVWPLVVLLGCGILALDALGYRTAAAFYATRVLWCALAFLALGIVHGVLRALIHRRLAPVAPTEDEDVADQPDRLQLGARFFGGLLTAALVIGLFVTISAVFDLRPSDWSRIGAVNITGGESGTGLTLGRIVRAFLMFWVGLGLARFLRDIVRSVLRARQVHKGSRYVVRTLLFYTLVTLGTLAALSALGIEMSQFGWFLTAAGVGIGFGLQEIISNFICGLILFFERPVQVGDVISVGDVLGDVQQINIRSTVVRTRDGVAFILPNKKLITEDVVNWSHGEKRTRVNVPVSVAYGSDVPLVRSLLLSIATEDERIMKRPAPEVNFRAFGESELQFELMAWLPTPDPTVRRRVVTSVNTQVDARFREHGVEIPFPQRDLHVRSSSIGSLGLGDAKRTPTPPEA